MGGNGAVAPHAAMTKTGHQAQRNVVNPADTDADVVTAFHPDSETERTLLFGSNFVEIQPSTASSAFGTSQTFTFSNDVDAIGDVYCCVRLANPGSSQGALNKESLIRIIDRVEVMVGNSTWQTMENADIVALASTMQDYGAQEVTRLMSNGAFYKPSNGSAGGQGFASDGVDSPKECWFPLGIFTAGGPKRAHLVAGAPHQSFRIKLTYAQSSMLGDSIATSVTGPEVELWARQHIMTNFERDQIRSNTIAKTLNLTQHMEQSVGGSKSTSVECDSFSLLASHLLVTLEDSSGQPVGTEDLQTVELLLNTSSHSGQLDAGFMISSAPSSMGLKTFVPGADETSATDIDGNGNDGRLVYVFPIAATAWGPDGCPFNRFDTIRLKLNFAETFSGLVSVTCCGTASAVYAKQAASLQYHS